MAGTRRGTCTVNSTVLAEKIARAGWTQKDFAAEVTRRGTPVGSTVINRVLSRGRTSPALRKAIADALQCEVQEIEGDATSSATDESDESAVPA